MLEIFRQHKVRQPEAEPFLDKAFAELEAQSARMTTAINKLHTLSAIDTNDTSRDEAVRAIHCLIQGYLSHPDEAVRSNATVASNVFKQYGLSIVNENYAAETALIESLLNDFDKDETKAALAALSGLTQSVEILRTANAKFVDARVAYEKELALSADAENATAVKKEILDTINRKILVYLTAMDIAEPERYATLAAEIEQVVNTNNETVRRRLKKKDNE